tara:strand:+ start:64023 stop:65399 length:1377 start_codon:yes stop_codon:yes gene_type:complete
VNYLKTYEIFESSDNDKMLRLDTDLTLIPFKELIPTITSFLNKIKISNRSCPINPTQKLITIGDEDGTGIDRMINIINHPEFGMRICGIFPDKNGKTNTSAIKTPKDIIDYISTNYPYLINNKVFKKLNEGWVDDIKNKFKGIKSTKDLRKKLGFKRPIKKIQDLEDGYEFSLNNKFSDMNYYDAMDVIVSFIGKLKIPYHTGGRQDVFIGNRLGSHIWIHTQTPAWKPDEPKVERDMFNPPEVTYDSVFGHNTVATYYEGYEKTEIDYKEVDSPKELIEFISKYLPNLANDKVFKKINNYNEKLNEGLFSKDKKLEFADFDKMTYGQSTRYIKKFLNKIKIKSYRTKHKQLFSRSILSDRSIFAIENPNGSKILIEAEELGEGKDNPWPSSFTFKQAILGKTKIRAFYLKNGSGDYKFWVLNCDDTIKVKNSMDIIKFISKHMPELVNNDVFKKLNK